MSRLPAGLVAYRLLTGALEPLAPLALARRARRGKEDKARLAERLGRSGAARPSGPLAWLHAASVGEGLSLIPLIEALTAARPDLAVLVTSGTVTSAELLARRLPANAVHQFVPVDAPGVAARFLEHWRPNLAVFVESELWPNLILAARARGVPLALVSARLSPASLGGWARAPAAARALLSAFRLVLPQEDGTAARLSALGARDDGRLNLKRVGGTLPVDEAALGAARAAAAGRPVLLAASTHPGEEALALDAFATLSRRPDRPLLVMVPRHPERGAATVELARARGLAVTRHGAGEPFDGRAAVHVDDRLGELGLWFRLSRAALIGGSLVSGIGGHNPLEAARLGTPILAGPWVENWRDVYVALASVDAYRLVDTLTLASGWAATLDDAEATQARAAKARAVAQAGAQALDQAVPKLLALLP